MDSLPAEPQGQPKNTGVGSLSLLQQIFPTHESNWGLLLCRQILYQLSYDPPSIILLYTLIECSVSTHLGYTRGALQPSSVLWRGLLGGEVWALMPTLGCLQRDRGDSDCKATHRVFSGPTCSSPPGVVIKFCKWRDFTLVVQWLRLGAPNVGNPFPSLVRELDPACPD